MQPQSREEWLKARASGIGASDAASILGLSPWKTNVQLWEEKTGRRTPEDIGYKAVVQYGKTAEEYLRELFKLDFPEYAVGYDEFFMHRQAERPWLFATLDGDLTEISNQRKGILEIKTTEIMRSTQWNEWKGNIPIPQNYYIQVLHQFLATNFDFAKIKAQIKYKKNGEVKLMTTHTHIERSLVQDDLDYLLKEEEKFWWLVKNDKRPNLILPEI